MKRLFYILAAFAVLALIAGPVNAARYEQLYVTEINVEDANVSDDLSVTNDVTVSGATSVSEAVIMGAEPITSWRLLTTNDPRDCRGSIRIAI